MSDGLSQDDRDADARAAAADIEAVLERWCPELKVAFWAAVDRYYRLDAPPGGRPEAVAGAAPDGRPPSARDGEGSPSAPRAACPRDGCRR